MAGEYRPTDELVAVAWLAQYVPELTEGMVATTLPAEVAKWLASGFVQVQSIGRGGDIDTPERKLAAVQVSAWAVTNTGKPAWGKAGQLAAAIEERLEAPTGGPVTLPAQYAPARVLSVYVIGRPRRVEGDPSGYGRFDIDLALDWVRA
jgi:hypothetical protein